MIVSLKLFGSCLIASRGHDAELDAFAEEYIRERYNSGDEGL